MENILNPIVLISLGVLIALHVASILLRGIAAKLIAYLNIALHVGLMFVLLYLKLKIEEAVLVYLISVFAYTLAATVTYKVRERAAKRESEPAVDGTPSSVSEPDGAAKKGEEVSEV